MEQLRANIGKNQHMVRKAAPITIESTGFAKLSKKIEDICRKVKGNTKP